MTTPALAAVLLVSALAGPLPPARAAAEASPATMANLVRAFESDTHAQARYAAFAEQADREGYRQVARLFRASAQAEGVRARSHAETITRLGGTPRAVPAREVAVKGTRQNLLETLAYENAERLGAYPGLARQARKDGVAEAVLTFTLAHSAEEGLVKLYQETLANLEQRRKLRESLYVCATCGHVTADATGECPVCHSGKEVFARVD